MEALVTNLIDVDWSKIHAPEDDGAARHLTGTAVAPVPTTATRLAVKSTPSFGKRLVWYQSPLKSSRPLKSGMLVSDRLPTAAIR